MKLHQLLEARRAIRVMGVDDAHYSDKTPGSPVAFSGVVCANTRIEGMVWGHLAKDGLDATDRILESIKGSKFHPQLHLVLLDGITFGGFNVVDLPKLSAALGLPVAAILRRRPDLDAFRRVADRLPDPARRHELIDAAGPLHESDGWTFQVVGESPEVLTSVLDRLTDRGRVPEALRIAHLIGSAVMTGESSRRA